MLDMFNTLFNKSNGTELIKPGLFILFFVYQAKWLLMADYIFTSDIIF